MMQFNSNSTHLLIRHQEISLKGKNRPFFERRLIENIRKCLKPHQSLIGEIQKMSDRFVIPLKTELLSTSNLKPLIENIAAISGVCAVAPCQILVADEKTMKQPETIEQKSLSWIAEDIRNYPEIHSFAVRARRTDKTFPVDSMKIEKEIGSAIFNKYKERLEVDLKNPQLKLTVEIRKNHTLIYSRELAGVRGLPMDSSQRVICLLSGGIDSPVAAYEIMRRGCTPVFVHFHSHPFTSEAAVNKVKKLAKILRRVSPSPLELWLVPLLEIQRAVRDHCNERYRTIHYRRFMMAIAQEFAVRRQAMALVTGEAIGQVASQTLTNLMAIEDAVTYPVLRPLITSDKEQIIAKAKIIGTYETSIEPHDDSCQLFAPARPSTQARLSYLKQDIENLPFFDLVFSAVDRAEKIILT